MDLTLRDEQVLGALSLNGDSSIVELARELKIPAHLIRNSIERLKRKRLILHRLHLDLYLLGLVEFSIYFSLAGHPESRAAALEHLFTRSEISWAVELLGDFQYACSAYFRSIHEFQSFLQDVHDRYPGVIQAGSIITTLSLKDYGFAGGGRKSSKAFRYGFSDQSPVKLDNLDHRLIRALSQEPSQSLAVIARNLRVPVSSLNHRLHRLRDTGLIQGTQVLFNCAASQFGSYRILVSCPGAATHERMLLEQLCAHHPLVYFLVEVAGDWNFEVGVFSKSAWDVNKFAERVSETFCGGQAKTKVLSDARLISLNPFPVKPPDVEPTTKEKVSRSTNIL